MPSTARDAAERNGKHLSDAGEEDLDADLCL
jgi:hypothetical protein